MRRMTRAAGLIGAICMSVVLTAQSASPVADAAMARDTAAVRALLKQGADVNAAQGDGMTALHWAASHGDLELAQMLMHAGANLRATTRINAYTPLFLASREGQASVVDALLKAGAEFDPRSSTGSTPLMLAAASGNVEAVQRLLDAGADVKAKENARGQTPLMFAAAYDRVGVVELLLKRGADLGARVRCDFPLLELDLSGFPPDPAGHAWHASLRRAFRQRQVPQGLHFRAARERGRPRTAAALHRNSKAVARCAR